METPALARAKVRDVLADTYGVTARLTAQTVASHVIAGSRSRATSRYWEEHPLHAQYCTAPAGLPKTPVR